MNLFSTIKLILFITSITFSLQAFAIDQPSLDYDIVYVRAPRYGDVKNTRWPEVRKPVQMEPGADLMLLHPDGSEELLIEGGHGSVIDPYVSFDGKWVFFSYFHDLRPEALDAGRRYTPIDGADIYKINLETRKIVRLTSQEFTPNTGATQWSANPSEKGKPGESYLGYGVFNLGPCPLPDGKLIFTSSRNGFLPAKDGTFPNLQLFVMDDDGGNVEFVGHMNLGSALHPSVLTDGRVMFGTYESQGVRDKRLWGIWAIHPDGTNWEPLVSAFSYGNVFHFQTQISNGKIVVEHYYNLNNNGFGSLFSLPLKPPAGKPPFGSPNARDASNPRIQQGSMRNRPRFESFPFSPNGFDGITSFASAKDAPSLKNNAGEWEGKVTHPSAAPNNDLLLVWSDGPVNLLGGRGNNQLPRIDGGIYVIPNCEKVASHRDLVLIKNEPEFNEMQPRAVVTYKDIYGIDEPKTLPWLPNNGKAHEALPAGTPFGLVGSSSLYKRNTAPGFTGIGIQGYDGLDPFNANKRVPSSNWTTQGADAGKYFDSDIFAIRVLSMEPTTHFRFGPQGIPGGFNRSFHNHANERLRILGELPLRKTDERGKVILDPEGNPDTSFLVKIPADVPFTFQTLDKNGMVLNMSQTWHQLRPGEVRFDCGGCHAHAQMGLDFESTYASTDDYKISDLADRTTLLEMSNGSPTFKEQNKGAVDVEYFRDIKPILQSKCAQCHTNKKQQPPADLVLDDEQIINRLENTYNRLANDQRGKYGRKPMSRLWRDPNATRYIRKFQSRRSLLVWKIFGERLDGWSNEDHPTETVPGDPSTFPRGANIENADIDYVGTIMPPPDSGIPALTDEEKLTIVRWIDLGCPINTSNQFGWFLDDLRPTLTLTEPRIGKNEELTQITIGMHDYYSGLDLKTFEVIADFDIDGIRAGKNLANRFRNTGQGIWQWKLTQPKNNISRGNLNISVKDRQGNLTRIERAFRVD